MFRKLRFAKRLFHDLPNHAKLAYCLLRDDRVPARNKAAFGAALAIGLNPFVNVPEFIPVVGELDALAVTLLALRIFIASAPAHLVEEHRQSLSEGHGTFDKDVRTGSGFAAAFTSTIGHRFRKPVTTVDQPPAETHQIPATSSERRSNA